MEIINIFNEFLKINNLDETNIIFKKEVNEKIDFWNYKLWYKKLTKIPKNKYDIKNDLENIPYIFKKPKKKMGIKYDLENTKIYKKICSNISEITNKTIDKNSINIMENNTSFGCYNNITNNKDFSFENKNNDDKIEIKKLEDENNNFNDWNNNLLELSFNDNMNKFGCFSDNLNINNKNEDTINENRKVLKSDIHHKLLTSDISSFDMTPKNKENEFYFNFNSNENKLSKDIKLINKNYITDNYLNKGKFKGNTKKSVEEGEVDLLHFNMPIYISKRKQKDSKILANKYKMEHKIAESTFCKTYSGLNINTNQKVCLKIIKDKKIDFDQSLLEIYILKFINKDANAENYNFLELYDYFYFDYKLVIVTNLLGNNLYDYYIKDFQNKMQLDELSKCLKNVLICLKYLKNNDFIHCDIKPENILIDKNNNKFKVIDFGNANYWNTTSQYYIQSRPYRAPECLLQIEYNEKIDIWSLGCIAYELYTKEVLFNKSVEENLAKMISICGTLKQNINKFSKNNFIYKKNLILIENKDSNITILLPKLNPDYLKSRIEDPELWDFITKCLQINYDDRITLDTALEHPFINKY